MSREEVATLRALEAASAVISPAPWAVKQWHEGPSVNDAEGHGVADIKADSDAEFIAAMRNALPALLDAAEERDRLRAALETFRVWADGFANPDRGMGAGLHAEMWPLLAPSAQRKMLELVGEALAAGEKP